MAHGMTTRTYTFSEHEIFLLTKALTMLQPKIRKKPNNYNLVTMMIQEFRADLESMEVEELGHDECE